MSNPTTDLRLDDELIRLYSDVENVVWSPTLYSDAARMAREITQLRLDIAQQAANTSAVLQAQGERDAAIEDVFRLLVAIRQYVAARQNDRGDLAAHWWTLQEIAKEPAGDVTHRPVPSAAGHPGSSSHTAIANEGSNPSGPAEQHCDCNYDDCRICFPVTRE